MKWLLRYVSWAKSVSLLGAAVLMGGPTVTDAADVLRYAIRPEGQFTYLPSPESVGIPGGMPSAHQLDFGVSGFFSVEHGEGTARLLDVDLLLRGNEAIQVDPPDFGFVTADRIEDWLEDRHFLQQPDSMQFHFYADEAHPGLELVDLLNGTVSLEGGFDSTPADGIGVEFRINAVAVPEPAAIWLACVCFVLACSFAARQMARPLLSRREEPSRATAC